MNSSAIAGFDWHTAEELECWVYLLPHFKPDMLSRPLLSDYRSQGEHGLAYVPREAREDLTDYYGDVQS